MDCQRADILFGQYLCAHICADGFNGRRAGHWFRHKKTSGLYERVPTILVAYQRALARCNWIVHKLRWP